jgi:hypothetical protein
MQLATSSRNVTDLTGFRTLLCCSEPLQEPASTHSEETSMGQIADAFRHLS